MVCTECGDEFVQSGKGYRAEKNASTHQESRRTSARTASNTTEDTLSINETRLKSLMRSEMDKWWAEDQASPANLIESDITKLQRENAALRARLDRLEQQLLKD